MGTRSLTVFTDAHGEEIVVMYRQFDGYLDGHGVDLAELLTGMKMVNGIASKDQKVANGLHCLAAQVVAGLKDGPGGIYLYPAKTRDCGEDYTYYVTGELGQEPHIMALDYNAKVVFDGPASELLKVSEAV